jgi:hypothetical protein
MPNQFVEHRTFMETHLAKSRRVSRQVGTAIPHIFTTSYLTHAPTEEFLGRQNRYGYEGPLLLSPGKSVGLRMIPTVRDLRFAWEEMPQQILDEQQQKVRGRRDRAAQLGRSHRRRLHDELGAIVGQRERFVERGIFLRQHHW